MVALPQNSKVTLTVEDYKQEERQLLDDVKSSLGTIGTEILSSKAREQEILQQSMMAGGPSSIREAMVNLIHDCNIGIRELSRQTGVKRKILLGMIEGRIDMPPEVLSKIKAAIRKKEPDLFEKLV